MIEPSARRFVEIPVDLLVEGEHFREIASLELGDLANSLKELQITPLIVRPLNDGKFEVLCGNLRLIAARKAGIPKLTCEVVEVSDDEALELQIADELHHFPRSPLERARMIKAYIKRYNLTQDQAAERLKVKRSTIAQLLRLLELPPSLQRLVGPLDYTTVLEIWSKLPSELQAKVSEVFAQRKLSQQEARRAIALIEGGEPLEIAVEKAILGPPLRCLGCSNLRRLLGYLGVADGDGKLRKLAEAYEVAAKILATLRFNPQMRRQALIQQIGVEGPVIEDALVMLAERGLIKLTGEVVSIVS
jgi:ParB/RepB/Spo0J family partition protein